MNKLVEQKFSELVEAIESGKTVLIDDYIYKKIKYQQTFDGVVVSEYEFIISAHAATFSKPGKVYCSAVNYGHIKTQFDRSVGSFHDFEGLDISRLEY